MVSSDFIGLFYIKPTAMSFEFVISVF